MLESIFVKEGFQIRLISPKPSPWGEGAPVRTLGRMWGRSTHSTGREKESVGATEGNGPVFLQGKVGYRIAPSSVTFGDSFPPRGSLWVVRPYMKKRPKSGHVHGPRNSPTTVPLRPITPKRASGNERAIKKGGPGGKAPGALSSGFLRRKPGSRPESGGNPRRRSGPAMVPTEPPADHRPPPSPGEFPRPQAGKESAIMF